MPADELAEGLGVAGDVRGDERPVVEPGSYDVIQTVVRPAAGAVLFAGSIGLLTDLPPWVGVVAGLLTAGGVHATKAAVRPAVTVSTGGLGNPVVSAIEDAVSLVVSVLAILAPVLMAVLLVIGGLLLWRWWRRRRRTRDTSTAVATP